MARRRSDDHVLVADLVGTRSTKTLVDRGIRDDTLAARATARTTHGGVREMTIATAANTGRCRNVIVRAPVVLARGRTTHDVRRDSVRVVEMVVRTERVVVVVVVPTERPAHGVAVVPVPFGRSRRPTDVAVARRSGAPHDPRAGIAATRNP